MCVHIYTQAAPESAHTLYNKYAINISLSSIHQTIISALNHISYTGLDLYAPTHYIQFQAWQGCMGVCEVQLIMSVFETVHIHHVHA